MEEIRKVKWNVHPYGCKLVYDLPLAIQLLEQMYQLLMKRVVMYGCYPVVVYNVVDLVIVTPEQLEVWYRDEDTTLTGIKLKYHLGFWEVITTPGNLDTKMQEMYVQYGRAVKGRYPAPTGQLLK